MCYCLTTWLLVVGPQVDIFENFKVGDSQALRCNKLSCMACYTVVLNTALGECFKHHGMVQWHITRVCIHGKHSSSRYTARHSALYSARVSCCRALQAQCRSAGLPGSDCSTTAGGLLPRSL